MISEMLLRSLGSVVSPPLSLPPFSLPLSLSLPLFLSSTLSLFHSFSLPLSLPLSISLLKQAAHTQLRCCNHSGCVPQHGLPAAVPLPFLVLPLPFHDRQPPFLVLPAASSRPSRCRFLDPAAAAVSAGQAGSDRAAAARPGLHVLLAHHQGPAGEHGAAKRYTRWWRRWWWWCC